MVSFICDYCQDAVKKAKALQHFRKCQSTFSCVDCLVTFNEITIKAHNSCISEAEKYEGSLYKNKQKNNKQTPNNNNHQESNDKQKKSKDKSKKNDEIKPIANSNEKKENGTQDSTSNDSLPSPSQTTPAPSTPENKNKQSSSLRSLNKSFSGNIVLDDELEQSLSEMDDEPMTPSKKRKRGINDDARNVNFSPEKKKIKTKYQLEEQLNENFKKKLALYEHLKLPKVMKRILKKAPESTMKYGQFRKEFEKKVLSKVSDDLIVLFETLIKKYNIEGDNVSLK